MQVLIIFAVIFIVIVFLLWRLRGGKNRFPWYEFYSRGRKENFSFKEISFIKRIAVQNKLQKPQSIFWSTRQLDRCLKPAIRKIAADEKMTPENKQAMMNKLLDLRTKAEFNLPKYKKRIRDTNSLLPRQKLIIRESTYGTFISWTVEITRKKLVVTQPSGQKEWDTLNWVSKKISVYFWRQEDAGYLFETKVLDQITQEEYPLLYLAHSSNLQRMQNRKNIRVQTRLRAKFNPVVYSLVEGDNRAFISKRGHAGQIIDISANGCCMLAGRMLKKNDRLKIDFNLTGSKRIIVLGVILNISKTPDERVRKYHIIFVKISPTSKNNILLYVYNIFGEREEDDQEKKAQKVNRTPPVKKEQAVG